MVLCKCLVFGAFLRFVVFGDIYHLEGGFFKVGPLPVITGFITPVTRFIRTVSHL